MARAVGDVTLKWGADTQLTITLASLASDTSLVTGRESASYDLSALDNVEDLLISGKITTGTGLSSDRQIEIWVAAPINDTPTWPDAIDGTDSACVIASLFVKANALKLAAIINTNNTSNTTYPFSPVSIASLFGGVLPKLISVYVVHNTGGALHATGSNHEISVQPVYRNAKLS